MERVSASLIEEIRSALIERYNRDQEIQQMIEEIGAEVERPKALGDVRGVSYIYALFCRFGLIRTPHGTT